MIGIYKIINPKGRIYIGQSVHIKKRWDFYKRLSCKSQIRLYNSFIKYGINNHKFEIIHICEISELNNLERYYQELYNVLDKKGLNCVLSKSENEKCKFSIETRLKMSNSQKGKKRSLESIEKTRKTKRGWKMPIEAVLRSSAKRKGFKHSDETKEKLRQYSLRDRKLISERGKNKVVSDETRKKISVANSGKPSPMKGKNHSVYTRKILAEKSSKIVINKENGVFYMSLKEAALSCNVKYASLLKQMCGILNNKTYFTYA